MMKTEVLIIDDDPGVLFYHELMVIESGLSENPMTFNSAENALYYINSKRFEETQFLIFLDLNMPRVSGWDLLDTLTRGNFKNIAQVIIVTSSLSQSDKVKAKDYKVVKSFWEKPMTEKDCKSLLGPF
ncbi:Response regulator receiver domain-containing protein [Belliella buryatensis]|uniref:Response regulator receiver domain-containing protein n=1 Tax=Belliella buryatensis TaxID=1500549 RepID=A0A239GLU5_9BACT|nr:response regulator [Belliella buryatensis]SNS70236.1 Response regulator receiver domain-containing protein [Belliella buryatensis]